MKKPLTLQPAPLLSSRPPAGGAHAAQRAAAPGHGSGWRWGRLLDAPHRIAFFLATLLLLTSALWWFWVQTTRLGWMPALPLAVSPTHLHAVVMVFGFMPLFFAGFLFTAGPKWLGVEPPTARAIFPSLLLQAFGWGLWLAGGHLQAELAWLGGAMAWLGLSAMYIRFARLLAASRVPDRVHARVVAWSGALGCLALAGAVLAVATDQHDAVRAWYHTGLWGFICTTFVAVSHRMIPFFTSSALPMVTLWRPLWVLGFLLVTLSIQVTGIWMEWLHWDFTAWTFLKNFATLMAGWVVLWLAFVWGLVQSMKIRLLAMLHIGFVWLGIGLLLTGFESLWSFVTNAPPWSIGALHAITMGFLGSLMFAMVTRVSFGHSGRTLVADGMVWLLFWLLQFATVLRVASAWGWTTPWPWLTFAAAALWLACMLPWGIRHLLWYGRVRRDGHPG